jgi:enoyl-CoA hydratase/carnithine racemase
MDYTALQVDRRDHVAWVTLNRPDALNAMNRALVRELRAFFSGLGEDRETRLVILRGAGRAFCAGLDLKEATGSDPSTDHCLRARRGVRRRLRASPRRRCAARR